MALPALDHVRAYRFEISNRCLSRRHATANRYNNGGADTVNRETILILDFGSQYTQLIARRVREFSVYSEVVPYSTPLSEIIARRPKGVILSGGPDSVLRPGAPYCSPEIFARDFPVLGICYGVQLMAHALGGNVVPGTRRE